MTGALVWRGPARVSLCPGWTVVDADGMTTDTVYGVRFAAEGGFLHLDVPGVPELQVIGAPALRLATYERADTADSTGGGGASMADHG